MRRAGFALLLAVLVMTLVTAALAVLVVRGRVDARRTVAARQQAQVRQLLLAAVAEVGDRCRRWGDAVPDERWTMPTPPGMPGRVGLHAWPGGVVEVTAVVDGGLGGETVRVVRTDGRWRVASADLGG